MIKKLKDTLLSENGMAVVNAAYFIALISRIKFLDYFVIILWLAFLFYSITHVKSKFMKVFYSFIALCLILLFIYSIYISLTR